MSRSLSSSTFSTYDNILLYLHLVAQANLSFLMHLSHRDHAEDGADSWVDDSEWADSMFGDIAETMRAHLDKMEVSEQEWQRRHTKRLFQIELTKSSPWYDPMTFLRMQPGVYGNAPRTPDPYDRTISKRGWERECKHWRHCVNETSVTLAAWKHCWLLAEALKQNAKKCGLGGSVGTQQVLVHQHMREWGKIDDKWHEHHRIQQECVKTIVHQRQLNLQRGVFS